MKLKYLLTTLLILSYFFTFSQEEDESCEPPKKKVEKLLIKAVNEKDAQSSVDAFNEAIEKAPENATVYFEYGMYAFDMAKEYYETRPNPLMGDETMKKAEEMFKKTEEHCKGYHADVYYYLGVINYSQSEMQEAIRWFKKFQQFKSNDPNKYSENQAKKKSDVAEVLKELEAQQAVKSVKVPFEPVLVRNVSSNKDEYFPMISPDNELMFYTRKLDRKNKGDIRSNVVEEFTFSTRPSVHDFFTKGEPLGLPFNDGTFDNYGAATLSVDNKEMILCACKTEVVYEQNYKNCDLYSTTYKRSGEGGNDFSWSPLKNLGEGINTKDGWEGQPTLSADGNTLYFASTRTGSQDNDIYVVEKTSDSTWGTAKPFDVINTAGKDKSPFLHQDSETLYFVSTVSKQRKGVGGLDIFYIRKENGSWSEPKNIGYPINSSEDELGLFVSTDGKLAYFSSRVGGDWNIYAFELYEEARPKSVAILKGELKDENGLPVKDATIEVSYENSDEVTEVKVNGDDGKYAAVVKTDTKQDVMVTVKKEGHAFDSKLISKNTIEEIKNTEEVSLRNNNLAVKELKVGEAYTINDILYATNSARLTAKSKFILKGFVKFLEENKTIKVAIHGHTDDVGDDAKNLLLSEERAQGVKNFLIEQGIAKDRLNAKGFGETKPRVENTSSANRAQNRRTEFVIEGL